MKYTFKWYNFKIEAEKQLVDLGKNYLSASLKSTFVLVDPNQGLAILTLEFTKDQPDLEAEAMAYFDTNKILRPNELVIGDRVINIAPKPGLLQTIWDFFYGD